MALKTKPSRNIENCAPDLFKYGHFTDWVALPSQLIDLVGGSDPVLVWVKCSRRRIVKSGGWWWRIVKSGGWWFSNSILAARMGISRTRAREWTKKTKIYQFIGSLVVKSSSSCPVPKAWDSTAGDCDRKRLLGIICCHSHLTYTVLLYYFVSLFFFFHTFLHPEST